MFQDISVGIKTFLRDEPLFNAISDIRRNYPKIHMIIADCGEMTAEKSRIYKDLQKSGHKTLILPFDSGFGMMSNAIVDVLERPFLLIGSDDFDYSTIETACGITRLQDVLKYYGPADIASGRVNENPYEFLWEINNGIFKERPVYFDYSSNDIPWFVEVTLTANYSLIRKDVFKKIRWDDDVKIGGGEHASFFYDCQLAGFKTVYVCGVNINEQKIKNSSKYNEYRRRANSPERPCFVKRGIRKYVLGNGQIDYEET